MPSHIWPRIVFVPLSTPRTIASSRVGASAPCITFHGPRLDELPSVPKLVPLKKLYSGVVVPFSLQTARAVRSALIDTPPAAHLPLAGEVHEVATVAAPASIKLAPLALSLNRSQLSVPESGVKSWSTISLSATTPNTSSSVSDDTVADGALELPSPPANVQALSSGRLR